MKPNEIERLAGEMGSSKLCLKRREFEAARELLERHGGYPRALTLKSDSCKHRPAAEGAALGACD
jgi:hypothetical protein